MTELYARAVWPIHAVDGDTSDLVEDDGRRQYTVRRDRDLGIDTPEVHAADPLKRAEAAQAKLVRTQWFAEHLAHNTGTMRWPRIDGNLFSGFVEVPYFILRSEKPDTFDRWLSTITCQAGHSLQQALLDAGLAVEFKP